MINRAPWADQYTPGPVPASEAIKHGWWYECMECGIMINEEPEDHDGNPIVIDPVNVGDIIYCTPRCRDIRRQRESIEKQMSIIKYAELERSLIEEIPLAIIDEKERYYYVSWKENTPYFEYIRIEFTFPKSKYGKCSLSLTPEGLRFLVPNGDREEFDKMRGENVK